MKIKKDVTVQNHEQLQKDTTCFPLNGQVISLYCLCCKYMVNLIEEDLEYKKKKWHNKQVTELRREVESYGMV